jgi:hypothetical protein
MNLASVIHLEFLAVCLGRLVRWTWLFLAVLLLVVDDGYKLPLVVDLGLCVGALDRVLGGPHASEGRVGLVAGRAGGDRARHC